MTNSKNDNSVKFNELYKTYNQLVTNFLNHRIRTLPAFTQDQNFKIKEINKKINDIFIYFIENNLIDFFNFDLISLLLHNFENIFERLKVYKSPQNFDFLFEEIMVAQTNILQQLGINYYTSQAQAKEQTLEESIKDVTELKEQIKNKETHDIYELAATENQKKSDDFRIAFILIILIAVISVWFCSITKTYFGLKEYDYWFFKGTLVLTSVTLITYFLKLSVKYQKIADQCRQTKMELEAFPSFIASFTTEDPKIIEIRKELALKYFGRDLYNLNKDDTGGIVAEQMRSTTEMVKATTEAIKNLKD